MSVGEVLLRARGLSSHEAAHMFADAGVPVFPCVAGGKRPLTAAGFLDASVDHARIDAWWSRWSKANLAVPTGAASGIEVVDVDVDISTGRSGFPAFIAAEQAGLLDGECARVRTPSGGMHVYFPSAPGRPQRCWQSARAHIDFRGDGGYIVVPPSSLTLDGKAAAYRLASLSSGEQHAVDASALRCLIDPASIRPRGNDSRISPSARTPTSFDPHRLAAWVGRLQKGERNHGLFWASCRLTEAGLTALDIENTLGPAAECAGLAADEITTTVRSARRHVSRAAATQRSDPDRPGGTLPIGESCRR